jgi:hypothetical protein
MDYISVACILGGSITGQDEGEAWEARTLETHGMQSNIIVGTRSQAAQFQKLKPFERLALPNQENSKILEENSRFDTKCPPSPNKGLSHTCAFVRCDGFDFR